MECVLLATQRSPRCVLTSRCSMCAVATCELLIEAGKVSSDKRNEMILVSDVLGIESLVDMMEHERFAAAGSGNATASAILGPFYRTVRPLSLLARLSL